MPFGPIQALDPAHPTRTIGLRVEDDDVRDVLDGPKKHFHELHRLVPQCIRPPFLRAVFDGIRDDGALKEGLAYCSSPEWAFTNNAVQIPPQPGRCFVVFVNHLGAIFDWDWIPQGEVPGVPRGSGERFRKRLWP